MRDLPDEALVDDMNRARFKPGDHVLLGDTFFHVESVMGVGGMGSAYRVTDNLSIQYVLKVMHAELARVAEYRKSFKWEARVGARIRSVHLVRVRRLGTLGDAAETPYFLMDYVPGPTIRDLQRNSKRLRLEQVLNICLHVLQGLEVLHDHGIVHQDIKPANVILTKIRGEQVAKILDLGVIRVQRVEGDKRGWAGTPPYSAPEQILGMPIGPQTDLFAVGVMLYELLTGERPYPGNTEMDAIRRAHMPAPTLGTYDGCPPSVVRLVAKALSLRPENRFASASDMADAIETIVAELDPVDPQSLNNTRPDLITSDSSPSLMGQSRPTPIVAADLEDPTSPAGVDVERIRWHLAAASEAARGEPPKVNPYARTEPGQPLPLDALEALDRSTLLAGKAAPAARNVASAGAPLPAAGTPPSASSPGTKAPPSPGTAVMPMPPVFDAGHDSSPRNVMAARAASAPSIASAMSAPSIASAMSASMSGEGMLVRPMAVGVTSSERPEVGAGADANEVRTKGGRALTPAMRTEPMRAPFNPELHDDGPVSRTAMIQKPAAGNPANQTTPYWGQQRATLSPPKQESAATPAVMPGALPIARSMSPRNSIPPTFGVFHKPAATAKQASVSASEPAEAAEAAIEVATPEPRLPWFRKWFVSLKKRWRKAAKRRREVREIKKEESEAKALAKKHAIQDNKMKQAADKLNKAREKAEKRRQAEAEESMHVRSTQTKLILSILTGIAAGMVIFVGVLYYFTSAYNQHHVKLVPPSQSTQSAVQSGPPEQQQPIQTENSTTTAEKGPKR